MVESMSAFDRGPDATKLQDHTLHCREEAPTIVILGGRSTPFVLIGGISTPCFSLRAKVVVVVVKYTNERNEDDTVHELTKLHRDKANCLNTIKVCNTTSERWSRSIKQYKLM